MGGREKRERIFRDTRDRYQTNPRLRAAVEESSRRARLYLPGEELELPVGAGASPQVTVTSSRTFEAARRLIDEDSSGRVAVLNFASATNPGGGVLYGSAAQEECLCRCSTLYPTLDQERFWDGYYSYHRERNDVRYTDACIYSPGVVVFKSDEALPEPLPEDEWYEVDVVTCAAPNLRAIAGGMDEDELYRLHVSRGRRICEVAATNGATTLVLGAFGCGAFCNDPWVVARAYKEVLVQMGSYFQRIEFAIFCAPGGESENLRAFEAAFA